MEGLDLRQPLSGEHQQLLYDLWREHLLLVFRAGYLDPGTQERVLRYLPHDAEAIDQRRFCNAYFQPRVPSNPVVWHSVHQQLLLLLCLMHCYQTLWHLASMY